jgi:hypothetical protein
MWRFISLSALVIGVVWVWNVGALGNAIAGWLDDGCHMSEQFSCGGCAIKCPADKIPVCRAGMNVWHGKAWYCSFQPTCACQKSIWEISRPKRKPRRAH